MHRCEREKREGRIKASHLLTHFHSPSFPSALLSLLIRLLCQNAGCDTPLETDLKNPRVREHAPCVKSLTFVIIRTFVFHQLSLRSLPQMCWSNLVNGVREKKKKIKY